VTSKESVKFPAVDLDKMLPLGMPLKSGILQKIWKVFLMGFMARISAKLWLIKAPSLCKITGCQDVTF